MPAIETAPVGRMDQVTAGDVTVVVWRCQGGAMVEVRCAGGPPRQVWAPAQPTPLDDEYLGTEGDR
jgi:hypothetical protein